jgi:hypothetical protein
MLLDSTNIIQMSDGSSQTSICSEVAVTGANDAEAHGHLDSGDQRVAPARSP